MRSIIYMFSINMFNKYVYHIVIDLLVYFTKNSQRLRISSFAVLYDSVCNSRSVVRNLINSI